MVKATQVETRKLDELTLWEQNPRSISEEDFDRLKAQIERLGVYKPILVNQDNIVLGGNMRTRALKSMGVEEVLVSVVQTADEGEMLEYALSDNDQVGRYEEQQLAELLSKYQISLELYRVDLGTPSNLQDVVSKFEPLEEDEEFVDEDDGEAPVSKLGDLFQLGEHRLLCGDSTDLEQVQRLMNGEKAQLVFTDPPYMVDYQSPSGLDYDSKKFGNSGKIFNDNLSDEDALKFFTDVATNLKAVTRDSAAMYWWFAMKNIVMNRAALAASGWYVSQTLIWLKNSMVYSQGQDFHRVYEPCLFAWKEGQKHFKNVRIANYQDVIKTDKDTFEEMLDVWYERRDNTSEYIHPTQKPTKLVKRALKKHTRRGDLVIDLFGGSGSTLIGCHQLGRRANLMELDPKYCDAIRKRFAKEIGREDWVEATPVLEAKS